MSKTILYSSRKVVRRLRREIPLEGPGQGFTTADDGREEITVSVELDLTAIDYMACKAAVSKSGQSVSGPLKVKVVSKRKL